MDMNIIGKEHSLCFIVDEGMLAHLDGTQIHPVCSTVTMTYYAELVARKLIEPLFEGTDQAIGGGIMLNHIAMAGIGERIVMHASITFFDGKKLISDFQATIEGTNIVLCTGNQTQYVLDKHVIDTLIDKLRLRNIST